MISVIVIGKNEGERLVACLRSIQTALSALAHEVVYVDSCSTDQSLQTAKALGARCFLLAERKTTAGLGRFVGAKEARGEYLLFLDGDMQLQPGFAEKALMAIAAKGYDGVCGIREDVYLRGGEVVCRNDNYFGCTQERLAPVFGGALMITRDALDACGGWATDTIACEEAELYARLKAIGCRIAEIPVPMILHTDAVRDSRSPLSTVFSAPKSAAARHLVFPGGADVTVSDPTQERRIRLIFRSAKTTSIPLVARLATEENIAANVISASTQKLSEEIYGSMLLGVPAAQFDRAWEFLSGIENLQVEEASVGVQ